MSRLFKKLFIAFIMIFCMFGLKNVYADSWLSEYSSGRTVVECTKHANCEIVTVNIRGIGDKEGLGTTQVHFKRNSQISGLTQKIGEPAIKLTKLWFCLAHDVDVASSSDDFKVEYKYEIDGRTTKVIKYTKNDVNEKVVNNFTEGTRMAYILAHSNEYFEDKATRSYGHYFSKVQWALWGYTDEDNKTDVVINKFFTALKKKITADSFSNMGVDSREGKSLSSGDIKTNASDDEIKEVKQLIQDADTYEKFIGNYSKINLTDENRGEIKVDATSDENNYIIGPIKVTFTDAKIGNKKISGLNYEDWVITDASGNEIAQDNWSLARKKDGVFRSVTGDEIESGKNFYIFINKSIVDTNGIGNITISDKVLKVTAKFYQIQDTSAGQTQSVVLNGAKKYITHEIDISVPIPPDTGTTSLKIVKKDADTGEKMTGAQFVVYRTDNNAGYYMSTGEDGTVHYTSDINQANTWTISEKNGITIEGLEEGTYKIIETYSPYDIMLQSQENREKDNVELKKDVTVELTFTNRRYTKITILKSDVNTGKTLEGVGFVVTNLNNQYIKTYSYGRPSSVEFTDNISEAEVFYTNEYGFCVVANIPYGRYGVTEVAIDSNKKVTAMGLTLSASKFYISSDETVFSDSTKVSMTNSLTCIRKAFSAGIDYIKYNHWSLDQLINAVYFAYTGDTSNTYLTSFKIRVFDNVIKASTRELNKLKQEYEENLKNLEEKVYDIFDTFGILRYIDLEITDDYVFSSTEDFESALEDIIGELQNEENNQMIIKDMKVSGNYTIYKDDEEKVTYAKIKNSSSYEKIYNDSVDYLYKLNGKYYSMTSESEETVRDIFENTGTIEIRRIGRIYKNVMTKTKLNKFYEERCETLEEEYNNQRDPIILQYLQQHKISSSLTKSKLLSSIERIIECTKVNSSDDNASVVNFLKEMKRKNAYAWSIVSGRDPKEHVRKVYEQVGVSLKDDEIMARVLKINGFSGIRNVHNTMGGTLQITKKDGDSGQDLTAKFRLSTTVDDEKYYYDDDKKEFTTTDTSFTVSGSKTIENLPQLEYILEEIEAPEGYNLDLQTKQVKVNIVLGKTTYANFQNIKYGKIKIIKETGSEKKLQGVTFGLYKTDGTTKVATLTTGSDGTVTSEYLRLGKYILKEENLGSNIYYEIDAEWKAGKEVEVVAESQGIVEIKVINNRRYIDLSGYVWEDGLYDVSKTKDRNELYQSGTQDTNDKKVSGIKVYLKKGDTVVAETTTNSSGIYKFTTDKNGNPLIDVNAIEQYSVEFEYNGMKYEAVVANIENIEKGSKAADVGRQSYNEKFVTIEKDYAVSKDGTKHQLSYTSGIQNNISTSSINYGGSNKYYAQDTYYNIKSSTNGVCPFTYQYTKQQMINDEVSEITNINLGIKERKQPDNHVVSDIENVKLTMNGYEHIYDYGDRNLNAGSSGQFDFNIGVETSNAKKPVTYTRQIYKSDISYNKLVEGTDVNSEEYKDRLQAYVTYKVVIGNSMSNATNIYPSLKSQINQLVDYYDSNYTFVGIGKAIGQNGEITQTDGITVNNDTTNKKLTINLNNAVMEDQGAIILYLNFKINDDMLLRLLNGAQLTTNIAEITSYSTLTADNKPYAGIDVDSQPGNANRNASEKTFEDDTDKSPTLTLTVEGGRAISGTVWEDSKDNSKGQNTRLGNGIYDVASENTIGNVEVELLVKDGDSYKTASTYWYDESIGENIELPAKFTTGKDGKYVFNGIIPDNYMLKYTYNNNSVIYDKNGQEVAKINAMQYKSTIQHTEMDYTKLEWYEQNVDTRYSDAHDDLDKRKEMDNTSVMNSTMDQLYGGSMDASTAPFEIDMEYNTLVSGSKNNYVQMTKNIDFGIIERPYKDVRVEKTITNLKLTNGSFNIEGNPATDNISGVKYLPDGTVFVEMDDDRIHGAQLQLEYTIKIINDSKELDYIEDSYYLYGTGGVTLRDITIEQFVDYINNEVAYIENDNWEKVSVEELQGMVSKDVEDVIKSYNTILKPKDEIELKNGETVELKVEVSKILTSQSEDITYDNDVEILKIKGLTGKNTKTIIPGNHIPSTQPNEADEASVTFTLTPPTGEDRGYTEYIMIGIVSAVIVCAGIIFIKKKVINK